MNPSAPALSTVQQFNGKLRVFGVHRGAVESTHPDAILRRARARGSDWVVARAARRGGANVRRRANIDFAVAVRGGADRVAAARRIRAKPASALRDLELGLLREFVSVLLCHLGGYVD